VLRAHRVTLARASSYSLTVARKYPLWEAALHRVRALLGPRKLNALRDQLSELIEAAPGFDEELPSGRSVKGSGKR
jgi:hypothetical protein